MNRMRLLRERMGISRAEFSRRASMNAGTYGLVEAGRFLPYDSQLQRISETLQWDGKPSELFDEVRSDD